MSEIEVFLQGEGLPEIALVRVPADGTVRTIVEAGQAHGLRVSGGKDRPVVLIEESDEPLDLDTTLEAAGIGHRSRVHVHRCRKIAVTVNFNVHQATDMFPPSTTVGRVKKWADDKKQFNLQGVDATDHLLQLCNSTVRPDEDVHIGTLVQSTSCAVCFDLVPKQRVEG